MKNILVFVLIICNTFTAFSQNDVKLYLALNGNLYMPFGSGKQTYPILGYDKDADPKILLGGFGFGFSAVKEWKDKFLLKAQVNTSRHAYWEEPMEFRDANNNPLGML